MHFLPGHYSDNFVFLLKMIIRTMHSVNVLSYTLNFQTTKAIGIKMMSRCCKMTMSFSVRFLTAPPSNKFRRSLYVSQKLYEMQENSQLKICITALIQYENIPSTYECYKQYAQNAHFLFATPSNFTIRNASKRNNISFTMITTPVTTS